MTLERVLRRATRWILKTNVGEMPYENRLTTLNQLPLVYDRELRDLVLVYKSIFGCIDLNIEQFVSFVQHSRSRSQNPSLVLKPSYCKTSTFQASFFDQFASLTPSWSRILLMWICHALGHSHATAPAIVPKLHYVYIFTVNRSFFFLFLFVI